MTTNTEVQVPQQTEIAPTEGVKTKYTVKVTRNVDISTEEEIEASTVDEARLIMQALIENNELTVGMDDFVIEGKSQGLNIDWTIDDWTPTVIEGIEVAEEYPEIPAFEPEGV